MANRIGQQCGNYRLIRLLGQGGFAEVYLGEHVYLERPAAIKILHTMLSNEHQANFLTEAQRLSRLRHPHIVRLLDFGIEGMLPFLVMEYAPNGSLRTRHPKGSQVPLETIVSYVKQVADALYYIHSQKLVHRDIKPENLLVGPDHEVLLSDLGIATLTHTTGSLITQEPVGTPSYMAPEQIKGVSREASDQYALGIVVYEWLCGARPFGGSAMSILNQHLHVSPPALREHLPTISPTIEAVVLKALSKDPKQRFVDVQAFATALEEANRAEQSQVHGLGSASHGVSRRTMVLGLGLAGLAIVSGSIAWLASSRQLLSPTVPTYTPHSTSTPFPSITSLYTYRGHTGPVQAVAWSPNSTRLASGSQDFTVQVWDAADGKHAFTYRGYTVTGIVQSVAWSPDGKYIASGTNEVQVWDAKDGGQVFIYQSHIDATSEGISVQAIAWSPNGKRIASAGIGTTVQVWDAMDGNHLIRYTGHSRPVQSVAWSPDGKYIASGSLDGTVQVWDATDGNSIFTYRQQGVFSASAVVWSPNGKHIASASFDNTVQIWDAADGTTLYTNPSGGYVVAWSQNSKYIASGFPDGTFQIWDATDGKRVFSDRGHSDDVQAVAWSPNGKYIASGSTDHSVRVWQVR